MTFDIVQLCDIDIDVIDGDRGKNYPHQDELLGTGYCLFLSAKNVTQNGFLFADNQFITQEKDELLNKGKLKRGDIVITTRGTVGNVAIYSEEVPYDNIRINSGMLIIRCGNGIDSYYLYQVLRSKWFYNQILSIQSGSAQPQLPKSHFLKMVIPIPDMNTQNKIAGILSSVGNKIALNTAINENLEQQAQAIFKSWFVDFEPFGGVMPDDWKTSHLLSVANYLNGLAMQKYRPIDGEIGLPVLKIKELRQGFCDSNSELCSPSIKSEYIIQNGDVIFSWSGSLLVDFWCGGQCGLNQHLFKVTSNTYDKWFYFVWTKYHLNRFIAIAADMATTMGHIKRSELEKSQVFIPNKADYKIIGSLLKPIYDTIINNRIENQRLAALRDTLLPKLMNGEIDVSKVRI